MQRPSACFYDLPCRPRPLMPITGDDRRIGKSLINLVHVLYVHHCATCSHYGGRLALPAPPLLLGVDSPLRWNDFLSPSSSLL